MCIYVHMYVYLLLRVCTITGIESKSHGIHSELYVNNIESRQSNLFFIIHIRILCHSLRLSHHLYCLSIIFSSFSLVLPPTPLEFFDSQWLSKSQSQYLTVLLIMTVSHLLHNYDSPRTQILYIFCLSVYFLILLLLRVFHSKSPTYVSWTRCLFFSLTDSLSLYCFYNCDSSSHFAVFLFLPQFTSLSLSASLA